MARRIRQPEEAFLRGKTRRHQDRERIDLILRGPDLGVPLWVNEHLWPCSACVKMRPWKQFQRAGVNRRCEPVCDACREHPTDVQQSRPRQNAVREMERRAGAIRRHPPIAAALRTQIERMAIKNPVDNIAFGILCGDGDKPVGLGIVEELLALVRDDWDVTIHAENYTAAITPPVTIVVLEPQDDLSGWTFDWLYDMRDNGKQPQETR